MPFSILQGFRHIKRFLKSAPSSPILPRYDNNKNSQKPLVNIAKSDVLKLNVVLRARIEALEAKVDALTAENLRLLLNEVALTAQLKKARYGDSSEQAPPRANQTYSSAPGPFAHRRSPRGDVEEAVRLARVTDLGAIPEDDLELDAEEQQLLDVPQNAIMVHSKTSLRDVSAALLDFTGLISREQPYPVDGGGYADVYRGTLLQQEKEVKAAIKVIRSHTFTEANRWKINKRLRREIRVWSCLSHPNVLPLLGIAHDFGPYISMVCPWMGDGDLHHYLDEGRASLTLDDRFGLLSDVAEGIVYLHSQSIVHGDITTGNILVDSGKACLSDFGLSNIVPEFQGTSFMSSTVGGALRWAAPELYRVGIDSEVIPDLTKPCDVYSFGSVMLQVISGRIPYDDVASDVLVLVDLMKGRYPRRPAEPLLTDAVWEFILSCWREDPRMRPDAEEVRQGVGRLRGRCEDILSSLLLGES